MEAVFRLSMDFVFATTVISIFSVDNSDNHLIQESILTLNDRQVLQQQISHQKVWPEKSNSISTAFQLSICHGKRSLAQ